MTRTTVHVLYDYTQHVAVLVCGVCSLRLLYVLAFHAMYCALLVLLFSLMLLFPVLTAVIASVLLLTPVLLQGPLPAPAILVWMAQNESGHCDPVVVVVVVHWTVLL